MPASIAIDKAVFQKLWKTNSPKRVNILIWAMIFGLLNCSSTLQRKLPAHYLSPTICPLCMEANEDLQHLFFVCKYAMLVGWNYWLSFIFCEPMVIHLRTIWYRSLLVLLWSPNLNYSGLMQLKLYLLKFGLREIRGSYRTNLFNGLIKLQEPMPRPGVLFLNYLLIFLFKIFV